MSRICLDTSAYSQFQRGDPRATELIDKGAWIGVPAIALGELWSGIQHGARREQNEDMLHEFLANPVVEVLDVNEEVGRHRRQRTR